MLERAPAGERESFLEAWRGSGCELALTLHHIQESGQGEDEAGLARRLDIIEQFPIVRSLPATETDVMHLEIQLQVYELLGLSPDYQTSGVATLFPLIAPAQLRATVALRPIYTQMREAYEAGAEASNSAKAALQSAPRLDLSASIQPEALDSEEMQRLIEDSIAGAPREVQELVRRMFAEVHREMCERGSARAALEAIHGILGVDAASKILDADLSTSAVFYGEARQQIVAVLHKTQRGERTDELYRRLDPYAAPGLSLRLAVQRARRQHPKSDEAGDNVDSAHVMFAPYVDLLFADRRTAAYVAQEARDRAELVNTSAASRVRRAGSLQAARDHLIEVSASN